MCFYSDVWHKGKWKTCGEKLKLKSAWQICINLHKCHKHDSLTNEQTKAGIWSLVSPHYVLHAVVAVMLQVLYLSTLQIESFWLPTPKWRTVPSSTATKASAKCLASRELRSCSSRAPASSWWGPGPWRAPCPKSHRPCWDLRSARWRSSTTINKVRPGFGYHSSCLPNFFPFFLALFHVCSLLKIKYKLCIAWLFWGHLVVKVWTATPLLNIFFLRPVNNYGSPAGTCCSL